jgi:chromosome partitioning protein
MELTSRFLPAAMFTPATGTALQPLSPLPPTRDVDDATFRDFIRLHVARQDAQPATIALYVREAAAFRVWLDGHRIPLRSLSSRIVREWVASLVAAGQTPPTISTKLSAVRRLLDAAVDADVLKANPAVGVRGPKDRREGGAAAQRTLSLAEIGRLLAVVDAATPVGERDRAMLSLLIGHGLRSVEVERINLVDVDLGNRQLRVKGKTRERTVFLRLDVTARIEAVLERRGAEGARPTDPLFVSHGRAGCNGKGSRLQRRGIRFVIDRAFEAAGLLPTGPKRAARADGHKIPTTHGLRATNVMLAIAGGAAIEHVAADVGHADIRTTMRYVDLQRRRETTRPFGSRWSFRAGAASMSFVATSRVVAIVNMKGGVGKTTTAANLGHAIARQGARVLAVDLDSQHNLTTWLGSDAPGAMLGDALRDPKAARSAIAPSKAAGVDLLHGSRSTALAERELQNTPAPATALRRALRTIASEYDVVLLDCPPGLGLLSVNAIVAANEVLVPVETRTMALAGLGQLRETTRELVDAEVLAKPPQLRVVATMHDGRTGLARDVLRILRESDGVDTLATTIRLNSKVAESFGHGLTVFDYAPTANGAAHYSELAKELA